jgi:DNA invertase Pin-like site-specific DNA recombinase
MKIAIYARVSTNNGQDPEMQLRELREYCQRRGWEIIQEYVDVGISGTREKRPQLDKLLADAHRRHFDVLVVWRFDRFARSVSHLLRALENFRSLGIEFVSLSEQVDTSTPTGKMIFTVLGAVAELERSLIVERVRAGLRNARAKGKKLGRPRKLTSPEVIGRMRLQGASWRAIGRAIWSEAKLKIVVRDSSSPVHRTLVEKRNCASCLYLVLHRSPYSELRSA